MDAVFDATEMQGEITGMFMTDSEAGAYTR